MSDNAVKLMRNDIANHGCVMGIAASAAIDRIEEQDKTITEQAAYIKHLEDEWVFSFNLKEAVTLSICVELNG